MVKKHTLDTTDKLWSEFLQLKIKRGYKNNDNALEEIITDAISRDKTQKEFYLQDDSLNIPEETTAAIKSFIRDVPTIEARFGKPIMILEDKKTNVFYTECHVLANELLKRVDIDAPIDPDNQEEYRANRRLQKENSFFKTMVSHATKGRQFSDIVIEYFPDDNKTPLKVLGGQHRCEAIKESSQNRVHGVRVYFNLDTQKRVDLYLASNSNIQVSSDLLDRLHETSLSSINKLRNWCYKIGIMKPKQDFEERRSSEEDAAPTVRMMRTFIINFYEGKRYPGKITLDAAVPPLAETGGMGDEEYEKLYIKYDFENETDLVEAGINFTLLHKKQFETIQKADIQSKKEFRIKSLNYAVVAAWAFAAGALQKDKPHLSKLYQLPSLSGDADPLNAKAMQQARHPVYHKNTNYRGLGTRTDDMERGSLLQLFAGYAYSEKPKITVEMCNAAIEIYIANRNTKDSKQKSKRAF